MRFVFSASLASLVLFAFLGCSSGERQPFSITPDSNFIFGNRPNPAKSSFVLIKLSEKPLLDPSRRLPENKITAGASGKNSLAKSAAERISSEQEAFLKKLKSLSAETQLVFRYRQVLNAVAVVIPTDLVDEISSFSNVVSVENAKEIARPIVARKNRVNDKSSYFSSTSFKRSNSAKWIGATELHQKGVNGEGVKVGIIDTGIDYTHEVFSGPGTEEAFESIDPSQPNRYFPNEKVVGGMDFVGSDFDSTSPDLSKRIPRPDLNPIDEEGHGTHVAGTVAGKGDSIETYDGVAPRATLYALKVFGKYGSTSDLAVVAAIEYAADPDQDGDTADRLDVLNLSLGGEYGDPVHYYQEAIRNIGSLGTLIVTSAGNSGDTPYIADSPSVMDDAFSVAASIDNMDHNWRFDAVSFSTHLGKKFVVEAFESTAALPVSEADEVEGQLLFVGLADTDFPDDVRSQLNGKVAFIDRGINDFSDKIARAEAAGAIGVVIGNNEPGEPFTMDGNGNGLKYSIPAIMISLELAEEFKSILSSQSPGAFVHVDFQSDQKIEKPELIDQIAGFSSRGPRSIDAQIKPEIAAPGEGIVSALIGGGHKGERMSGTSMATPHITGAIALIKQMRPKLSANEIKSLLTGHSKVLKDQEDVRYPVARQGGGRVQIADAIKADLIAIPHAISLGMIEIDDVSFINREIEVKNLSNTSKTISVSMEEERHLELKNPQKINLAAGQSKKILLRFEVLKPKSKEESREPLIEADGFVRIEDSVGRRITRIPVLAVARPVSKVELVDLKISGQVEIDVFNRGSSPGEVWAFNLIGDDGKKTARDGDPFRSMSCDLHMAGYRILAIEGAQFIQFAVKLHRPTTTWEPCEISVLFDQDQDGEPDQELFAAQEFNLAGLTDPKIGSVLLDFKKARQIRHTYESQVASGSLDSDLDYTPSILANSRFVGRLHSSFAIIETKLELLLPHPVAGSTQDSAKKIRIRLATTNRDPAAIEGDDFLENYWSPLNQKKSALTWREIDLSVNSQTVVGMPEATELMPGESGKITVQRGQGKEPLWLIMPSNESALLDTSRDRQFLVVPIPILIKPTAYHKQP